MPREPALLASAGRMPERSQHRVSGAQDGRSERPATGRGQPLTGAGVDQKVENLLDRRIARRPSACGELPPERRHDGLRHKLQKRLVVGQRRDLLEK